MKKIIFMLLGILIATGLYASNEDMWPRLSHEFLSNHENKEAAKAELEAEYTVINEISNSNINWDKIQGYSKGDLELFTSNYVDGYIENSTLKSDGMTDETIEKMSNAAQEYRNKIDGIYNRQSYEETRDL